MKLADYLRRFNLTQRADFALRVGTTVGHLNNVAYGTRTASAALTRSIARVTGREVPEWDLRPDDWFLIWEDLIGTEGAPAVAPDAFELADVQHAAAAAAASSHAAP